MICVGKIALMLGHYYALPMLAVNFKTNLIQQTIDGLGFIALKISLHPLAQARRSLAASK
jgi:hypothetical protein